MLTSKKLFTLSLLLIFSLSFSDLSTAAADQVGIINQNINTLKSTRTSSADRRDAVERLIKIGSAAVPALINALQDDNPIVRLHAVAALQAIGPEANEAVPGLIKELQNGNSKVRGNAAEALAVIGPWAEEAVPNLVNALQRDNPKVKVAAAWALGHLGDEATAALPVLIKALQDENSNAQENATLTLKRIRYVKVVSAGEQTWEDYMAAAKDAFNQENYSEAERLLMAALIETKNFKDTDPRVLITYRNFVLLYKKQKKFAQAKAFHDLVLKLTQKTLHPNDPNVGKELNNRATALMAQGKYAAAKELIEEALKINQQNFGKEHPNVATNLANLASIYYMEGNLSKAEQLYLRALAMREKLLGPNDIEVALTLINLAELYRARGEDTRAESILRRVESIKQQNETGLSPQQKPTAKNGEGTGQNIPNKNDKIVEKSPIKSESTTTTSGPFYANKKGRAYHYRSCYWVKNIPLDKLREFNSAEEAQEAGLYPCRRCRSPQ